MSFEDVPLFDEPVHVPVPKSTWVGRGKAAKATFPCPNCGRTKQVGLVPDGDHLVFRAHRWVTYEESQIECSGGGRPLCDARPTPAVGTRCPHEHRQESAAA
ncbi:hypothetical protein JCM9957A_17160 [Kineosporia succinea]